LGGQGRRAPWLRGGSEEADENADPAIDADADGFEAMIEQYGGLLPEMLDKLERTIAADALSLWTGFCAFCDECVGVAAEKVIAVALEPAVERVESLKARAERLGLEANPETVEEIREGLAESWRVVEERGV